MFELRHHPLNSNPLMFTGPSYKAALRGLKGLSLNCVSPFELRAIKQWCGGLSDSYLSGAKLDKRCYVVGDEMVENSMYYEPIASVWVPEIDQMNLIEFINALPKRTEQLRLKILKLSLAEHRLLAKYNYLAVKTLDDDTEQPSGIMLSSEPTDHAVELYLRYG